MEALARIFVIFIFIVVIFSIIRLEGRQIRNAEKEETKIRYKNIVRLSRDLVKEEETFKKYNNYIDKKLEQEPCRIHLNLDFYTLLQTHDIILRRKTFTLLNFFTVTNIVLIIILIAAFFSPFMLIEDGNLVYSRKTVYNVLCIAGIVSTLILTWFIIYNHHLIKCEVSNKIRLALFSHADAALCAESKKCKDWIIEDLEMNDLSEKEIEYAKQYLTDFDVTFPIKK